MHSLYWTENWFNRRQQQSNNKNMHYRIETFVRSFVRSIFLLLFYLNIWPSDKFKQQYCIYYYYMLSQFTSCLFWLIHGIIIIINAHNRYMFSIANWFHCFQQYSKALHSNGNISKINVQGSPDLLLYHVLAHKSKALNFDNVIKTQNLQSVLKINLGLRHF